ncbi:microfibril-associated glycoprotein 4-like isoform X2 [Anopheles funestus]|uniref:microfibril-associated glycoprotein 4-like isoform X2 n=1 Tax=Anopheles funestus TaxID=62324 RepID=UPI0020C6F5F4|nr:microfibril-associated glycoprotein 4-like isoform X2 [Anopheles funestus]
MIMNKLQILEDRSIRNEEPMVKRSCNGVPFSGIYNIQPVKTFKEPIRVVCEQDIEWGGWIVIQYRFNGSTNFERSWQDYKNGFGNLDGEFWLGLDRIHRLTASRPHELVMLLEDFDGNRTYAKYDQFEIGNEKEKYVLKKLGNYSGTAGDSFSRSKGMKFSTFDSDNDIWVNNCAATYSGGWWFRNCHFRYVSKRLYGDSADRFNICIPFTAILMENTFEEAQKYFQLEWYGAALKGSNIP